MGGWWCLGRRRRRREESDGRRQCQRCRPSARTLRRRPMRGAAKKKPAPRPPARPPIARKSQLWHVEARSLATGSGGQGRGCARARAHAFLSRRKRRQTRKNAARRPPPLRRRADASRPLMSSRRSLPVSVYRTPTNSTSVHQHTPIATITRPLHRARAAANNRNKPTPGEKRTREKGGQLLSFALFSPAPPVPFPAPGSAARLQPWCATCATRSTWWTFRSVEASRGLARERGRATTFSPRLSRSLLSLSLAHSPVAIFSPRTPPDQSLPAPAQQVYKPPEELRVDYHQGIAHSRENWSVRIASWLREERGEREERAPSLSLSRPPLRAPAPLSDPPGRRAPRSIDGAASTTGLAGRMALCARVRQHQQHRETGSATHSVAVTPAHPFPLPLFPGSPPLQPIQKPQCYVEEQAQFQCKVRRPAPTHATRARARARALAPEAAQRALTAAASRRRLASRPAGASTGGARGGAKSCPPSTRFSPLAPPFVPSAVARAPSVPTRSL
jgi:hypothetical protein